MNWLPRWDANAHAWHHVEFAVYVIVLLVIAYKPPRRSSNAVDALRGVFEAHWGDSIGLYLLHLGILLVILAGVWPTMTQVGVVGQSLIVAAMGVLKLTKTPPANGGAPPPPAPAGAAPGPVQAPANPSAPASAAPAGWGPRP